jgi:hypothetical protein
VQRTDVEQKATVYFPLSVGLDISQTPVTQRLRNETSGTSHFLSPRHKAKNCGLTGLASTIWRDTTVLGCRIGWKYKGKNANAILILNYLVPTRTIHTIAWNKAIFVVIEIVPPWMIVLTLILISSQSSSPGQLR